MDEIWADIPEYEGIYQISNFGNVRSLDRTRWVKSRYGGDMLRTDKGKRLIPNDNGYGYLQIHLRSGKRKEVKYIHRLVAEAFCVKPDGCNEVNHKDHNRKK